MTHELSEAPPEQPEGYWAVRGGRALRIPDGQSPFDPSGPHPTIGDLRGLPQGAAPERGEPALEFELGAEVVNLDYNNPFRQDLERVWFDGRIVYAVELGELDVDPATVKVAQEYQVVYDVELDEQGKLVREPERVPGQYNIYDSVPGMPKYSPLWQFNYVVVPRDYVANTLRSEADCLASGYPILKSNVIEN